jgi:formate hydrogenlyase transcriptional activator
MDNLQESLLLYLNSAVATARTKEALFTTLTTKLREAFAFDVLAIIVLDTPDSYQRVWMNELAAEQASRLAAWPLTHSPQPVRGTPVEVLLAAEYPTTIELADLARRYPIALPLTFHAQLAIAFLTIVPLRLNSVPMGVLCLAAHHNPAFATPELDRLASIGSLLAVALHNTLAFEAAARREREKTVQLAVNNALLRRQSRPALFQAVATELNQAVPCDHFLLWVQHPDGSTQSFAEFQKASDGAFEPMSAGRWQDQSALRQQAELFDLFRTGPAIYESDIAAVKTRYEPARGWQPATTRTLLGVPLTLPDGLVGLLMLTSLRPNLFARDDLDLVAGLVPQLTLAMQNLFAFEQVEALSAQLKREKTYLLDELNTAARFEDFVGPSAIMQQVQVRIRQVAPTPTTVLLTGETGTGKELAARALHNLSPRRERPLIKLNCAALPAQLIESELFGHEKGAFTGAYDRRIGKFEQADGGTIFLDEVGELPLDLQAKLLRVLQEKELERLGGRRVIRVDVRVIAATNRVLEDEVAAGRFRADLYYRLSVFPLRLPALRERPDDIEPLLRHFLERLTKQLAKPVRGLRARDLLALREYAWPGNVRELEHVVEHALIVSQGPFLEIAGPGAAAIQNHLIVAEVTSNIQPLQDVERAHILAALRHTQGRVSGPQGAARLLGLKPTTLEARMKKLGIRRTISEEA